MGAEVAGSMAGLREGVGNERQGPSVQRIDQCVAYARVGGALRLVEGTHVCRQKL